MCALVISVLIKSIGYQVKAWVIKDFTTREFYKLKIQMKLLFA